MTTVRQLMHEPKFIQSLAEIISQNDYKRRHESYEHLHNVGARMAYFPMSTRRDEDLASSSSHPASVPSLETTTKTTVTAAATDRDAKRARVKFKRSLSAFNLWLIRRLFLLPLQHLLPLLVGISACALVVKDECTIFLDLQVPVLSPICPATHVCINQLNLFGASFAFLWDQKK
jgi:hypothetical protein